MSSLLHKYGVVHRIATTYHPRLTAKLKKIGADSLRTLFGHIELHMELRWGCPPTGLSLEKPCNLAYDQVRKQRKFQLQELNELRLEADENSQIYKQKVKRLHDQQILRKEFPSRPESTHVQFTFKTHYWSRTNNRQLGDHLINGIGSDPKIEITLRRLRKARNIVVSNSSNSISSSDNSSPVTNISDYAEYSSTNNFTEQMENHNDRTVKELATPNVLYLPWCIQYPQLEPAQTYELKSGLIHLLPKFHGLVGEDSHKHLKEFHVICSTMRQWGIPKDYIKMKPFPFSLDGFYSTPEEIRSVSSWKSSFHYPELRPSGGKFVGSGNILEKLYTSIGKDSTSCVPYVYNIKSVSNC
ncbi:hypothetical protein CR513_00371, partial [Mucuna pruriens]